MVNMIGFGFQRSSKPIKSCVYCHVVLQPDPQDNTKLMCFSCGYSYKEDEGLADEKIKARFGTNKTGPGIVTGSKKGKKLISLNGHEVPADDTADLLRPGVKVISYREEKSGKDTTIDTRNRRTIRTRNNNK